MDQAALSKKLQALGLDEKESAAYIGLLRLGPAPVRAITANTGINRSSLYVVLDRLQKEGLVSIAADKGVRRYVAAAPEQLKRTAKERLERALLTRQALEALLPEIRSLAKHERHKPRMEVLPGREGLKTAFEKTLDDPKRTMRVFSSTKDIFRSLPDYLPMYVRERLRRNIKMIGIHPDDPEVTETLKRAPNTVDDLTVIPRERFKFPSDFALFDDKVSFMSHVPPYAVMIQSKGIADVMKTVFDLAHKEAHRIGYNPRTLDNHG